MQTRRMITFAIAASLPALFAACFVRTHAGETILFTDSGEKAERRESLPLELASGEELRVEIVHGDVSVRVSEAEAAHVDAHWYADGEDEAMAEAVLARFSLERKRGQSSLSVSVVGEPLEVKGTFTSKRYVARVDLSLVVPSGVKVVAHSTSGNLSANGALATCRLESSYGDLSADGTRGDTRLQTASGNVKLANIEASGIEATSQYGDIRASSLRGSKVRLTTSSGNVSAREVHGELSLQSSYGDLEIEAGDGDLEARTSSGNIALRAHASAKRRLVTSYGDISARGGLGELEAETASGSVDIDEFDGIVRAKSSYGDVKIRGRLRGGKAATKSGEVIVRAQAGSMLDSDWQIRSGYGDLKLSVPRVEFSCQLQARTGSGEIHFPGLNPADGEPLRQFEKNLDAGGKSLELVTTSGDIRVTLD